MKTYVEAYLGIKLSSEEFNQLYREYSTSFYQNGPFGEFLFEYMNDNRNSSIAQRQKAKYNKETIPLVTDTFAQCEKCHMWDRLLPVDETGMRTIPLTRSHYTGKKYWLCDRCLEEVENKEWE
jgi:hypothetical protein